MASLLEKARQFNFLDPGALPNLTKTDLAALTANYAAAVGSGGYKEPAELTEQDWDVVMKNNRALHGYYTDFKKGILVKAPKPAFRLRGIVAPGTPAETPKATDSGAKPADTVPGTKPADTTKELVSTFLFYWLGSLLKTG